MGRYTRQLAASKGADAHARRDDQERPPRQGEALPPLQIQPAQDRLPALPGVRPVGLDVAEPERRPRVEPPGVAAADVARPARDGRLASIGTDPLRAAGAD